jgi:hypothetical protein
MTDNMQSIACSLAGQRSQLPPPGTNPLKEKITNQSRAQFVFQSIGGTL